MNKRFREQVIQIVVFLIWLIRTAVTIFWISDPNAILYCKEIIDGYNPGGCFYDSAICMNGNNSDMYERAKKCYEDRNNRGLRRTAPILEQRMNGEYN